MSHVTVHGRFMLSNVNGLLDFLLCPVMLACEDSVTMSDQCHSKYHLNGLSRLVCSLKWVDRVRMVSPF